MRVRKKRERSEEGKKRKREKKKGEEKEKRERREEKERKREVGGRFRENAEREVGGCKNAGGGNRKRQGETLGFGVRWVWAGLGYSLAISQNFYFHFAK